MALSNITQLYMYICIHIYVLYLGLCMYIHECLSVCMHISIYVSIICTEACDGCLIQRMKWPLRLNEPTIRIILWSHLFTVYPFFHNIIRIKSCFSETDRQTVIGTDTTKHPTTNVLHVRRIQSFSLKRISLHLVSRSCGTA